MVTVVRVTKDVSLRLEERAGFSLAEEKVKALEWAEMMDGQEAGLLGTRSCSVCMKSL